MSKFVHPDITRIRREKEKQSSVKPKSLKGTKPTLIMKGLSLLKSKKEKQPNSHWVTNCTYNIELNYSYEEKIKVRQTQSC